MKYALAIVIAILLLPIAIVSLWLILAMCTIGPAVGQATSNAAAALHSAADTLQNAPDGLKSIAKEVSKPFVEARKEAERDRESEEQAAADAEHVVSRPGYLSWDDYGHHFEAKDVGDKTELYVDGKFEARFPLGNEAVIYADRKYNPERQKQ
jgi:hypothetical protein